MERHLKPCCDCKHSYRLHGRGIDRGIRCKHLSAFISNPVYGVSPIITQAYAAPLRQDEKFCGPEGKWWEEKRTLWQKVKSWAFKQRRRR